MENIPDNTKIENMTIKFFGSLCKLKIKVLGFLGLFKFFIGKNNMKSDINNNEDPISK